MLRLSVRALLRVPGGGAAQRPEQIDGDPDALLVPA